MKRIWDDIACAPSPQRLDLLLLHLPTVLKPQSFLPQQPGAQVSYTITPLRVASRCAQLGVRVAIWALV